MLITLLSLLKLILNERLLYYSRLPRCPGWLKNTLWDFTYSTFDKYDGDIILTEVEIAAACDQVPQKLKDDIQFAHDNVRRFAEAQKATVRDIEYEIVPGLIFTLVFWVVGSSLFATYLSYYSTYASTYAGLASIMIALVFLYIVSAIFILGGELNASIKRYLDARAKVAQ